METRSMSLYFIGRLLALGILFSGCRTVADAGTSATAPPPAAAATPAPAAPPPYRTADPAVECAASSRRELCAELLAMIDREQLARRAVMAAPKDEAAQRAAVEIDAANQQRLEQLFAEMEWPTVALVGKRAAGAAWTILQHADLAMQERYFDRVERAAERGDLDRGLYATMFDRIQLRRGQPQRYGTQFECAGGQHVPSRLEAPEKVDERRAEVGLPPLAEYTAMMRQAYGTTDGCTP